MTRRFTFSRYGLSEDPRGSTVTWKVRDSSSVLIKSDALMAQLADQARALLNA